MEIPVGAKGRVDGVVTDQLTAAAIGSGSVEVFATPYMVAAMENAACEALRPYYGEGENSVGTSVFIMAFTACTGSLSHFAIGGAPDWPVLILCVVFTLLWARVAARFANKADPAVLNRATGVVLVSLGVVVFLFQLLG